MRNNVPIIFCVFLVSCKDPKITDKINKIENEIVATQENIASLESELNTPVKTSLKPSLDKALKELKEKELEVRILQKKVDNKVSVYNKLQENFTQFKEHY